MKFSADGQKILPGRCLSVLRIVIAVILVQTLFFKYSGAEESKFILITLAAELYSRSRKIPLVGQTPCAVAGQNKRAEAGRICGIG